MNGKQPMPPIPPIPSPAQVYDRIVAIVDVVPNTVDSLIGTVRGGIVGLKENIKRGLRPPSAY